MSIFKDAKVLRSDETTLVLEELRILYNNLESGEHDSASLKKLTTVGDKLETAMGMYYQQCDAAILRVRAAVRSGADAQTAESAVILVLSTLDADQGQELAADVILTMNEWQWMMERWKDNKRFTGVKEIRLKLLRIEDAIVNAKGVKFINRGKHDSAAWIEGEPEPMYSTSEAAVAG